VTAAIEVENISVSLRGRRVLAGVSFTAHEGESVGLLGPNGAGKTTLLRCLLGLCRPSDGALRVLGWNPAQLRGGSLAAFRREVGYVPQLERRSTGVPLGVREVVEIARAGRAGLLRRLSAGDRRAVERWIDRMGLRGLEDRPYCELSGGQQRKVQLARALAQEPRVLLLDEPAANLDLAWQETLLAHIDEVSRTGITVLLVTHDISLLPRSCERVLVLANGRLCADGPARRVLAPETLSAVYGTPVDVERLAGRHYVIPSSPRGKAAGSV